MISVKAYGPLYLSKDAFFKNFDDSSTKDKVNNLSITIEEDDNGRTVLCFSIDANGLTADDEQRIAKHFQENYDIAELSLKLLAYYDVMEMQRPAPVSKNINEDKKHTENDRVQNRVTYGKSLALNRDDFFQDFSDKALEKKVFEVKIYAMLKDSGEMRVGFRTESAQPLSSDEYKKLEEHFHQKYTADEAAIMLARYYTVLKERGIDPIEHSDVTRKNRPKKDRDHDDPR